MDIFNQIQEEISRVGGTTQSQLSQSNMSASMAQSTLQSILSELQKRNNKGKPWLYVSDVLSLPDTITTQNAAMASPILNVTAPPQDMNLDTFAFAWDNNAQVNYKIKYGISSIVIANPNFIGLPSFTNELDVFNQNIIPLLPSTIFTFYAYNFNSATINGNIMIYILGFLQ